LAQLDRYLKVGKGELNAREWRKLLGQLTFNPTEDKTVRVYRERVEKNLYWLPRGALSLLPDHVEIQDKRSFPKLPKLEPKIKLDATEISDLYEGQSDAVNAALTHKQGVILRQPASGKSNIGIVIAARAGTRSLIIVHTEDLLKQWQRELQKRLPGVDIGIIRQAESHIGHITVATIQTLFNRDYPQQWWRQFGLTLIDEFHHVPARTFESVMNQTTSRYRLGLSASKTRADGMEKMAYMVIGPIIYERKLKITMPVTVNRVTTDFRHTFNPAGPDWLRRKRWSIMIKKLITNKERNQLIAHEVDKRLDQGRSVLTLSRRIDHLALIKEEMEHDAVIMAASGPYKKSKIEREQILKKFRQGKIKCVLATQLADEGLNVPILSCVCLAFPGKHKDKILQQVGRALREFPRKENVEIIDIVDENVKTLRNQWHERRRGYTEWGFFIEGSLRDRIVSGRVVIGNRMKRKVVFNNRRKAA